jgi:UDP-N-acetyl-D-galactosamine dehydrogenase
LPNLADYGIDVLVHDPLADAKEAKAYYGVELKSLDQLAGVDALVLAVAHRPYITMGMTELAALCNGGRPVIVDVKSVFDPDTAARQGISYWRL